MSSAAQSKMPLLPWICVRFALVLLSTLYQTNLIWINGHMPSENLVQQSQSKILPAVFKVTPAKIMQHQGHIGCCPVIPFKNLADRRCNFSNRSQSLAKWGSQMDAAYSSVERTNVIYAVSLSLAGQCRRFLLKKPSPGWSLHGCGSSVHERTKTTHL